jgi:hypothetical protein
MPKNSIGEPIIDLVHKGRITPETALKLRQTMYGDGEISAGDADQLFYLDRNCGDVCDEWRAFFIEALTDYLVFQVNPRWYVSEKNAQWLIEHIEGAGGAKTQTGLELLIKVSETALTLPAALACQLIAQVTRVVLSGEGPTRGNQMLTPGAIGAGEVELLRRVLYSAGGDGHAAITRAEAEALFDLNDATIGADNDPAWSDLFVKAIASYVMAFHGYVVPSREEALRRENWVEDNSPSFGGMAGEMVADGFSSMLASGLRAVWGELQDKSGIEASYGKKLAGEESRSACAQEISGSEAKWLASRIGRDGVLHANEVALLRFIRDGSPNIHTALKPLLDQVA